MFWLIVAMLIIGIILILLEAVVPFGLSIISGGVIIAASAWLCFHEYGPVGGGFYLAVSLAFSIGAAVWCFRSGLSWLALKPPETSAKGQKTQAPRNAMPRQGDRGRVLQPLHPTGSIMCGGQRWAARTLNPEQELGVGCEVVIQGVDSIYLLVEPCGDNAKSDEK